MGVVLLQQQGMAAPIVAGPDPWDLWLPEEIAEATGCTVDAIVENWPYLWDSLRTRDMLAAEIQGCTIATVTVETGVFKPIEEMYSAYWDTYSGGAWYHGRGYIQLTHDYNYEYYGDVIGVDLLNQPHRALEPVIAAEVLAIYFLERGVADAALARDWTECRRLVQGADAGLDRFIEVIEALGV